MPSDPPFTQAIADVRFSLTIPESRLAKILKSGDTYESGLQSVEEWVKDNLPEALEHADEPEVEADA